MKAKRRRRSVGIHPCTECGEGAFGTGTLARHLCTKHVYQQLKDLVRTRFPGEKKDYRALKNFGDMLWDLQYMRPTVFLRNYRNSSVFTLEY